MLETAARLLRTLFSKLTLALLLSIGLGNSIGATTLVPPSFDELVTKAEQVVRSEVTAVRTELRSLGGKSVPVTLVTLRAERVLVGPPASTIELVFLGGESGGRGLKISGQPTFRVGDRDVLFIDGNGRQICPLVTMGHGRYLLVEENASVTIARADHVPLTSLSDVELPLIESVSSAAIVSRFKSNSAMSLSDFEAAIQAKGRALSRTVPDEAPK